MLGLVLGLVLGCLLIWSWVINDIPRAALNPAGAGLGWDVLGWDGMGWTGGRDYVEKFNK